MARDAGEGEGEDLTSSGREADLHVRSPADGSPVQTYTDWKRRNDAVACLFARILASRPEELRQATAVVKAASSAKRIAASIDRQVSNFIADPETTGAAILLRTVTSLRTLVEVMVHLQNHAGWAVTYAPMKHPLVGDIVTVAVTRSVPAANGELPSEVLIFGDFDIFPPTRRAPVIALELYVGKALEFDPKDGATPSAKANLAHITIPSFTEEMMGRFKEKSAIRRTKILGGEDLRAKARVSFVIPKWLSDELGLL